MLILSFSARPLVAVKEKRWSVVTPTMSFTALAVGFPTDVAHAGAARARRKSRTKGKRIAALLPVPEGGLNIF
jgi:hypothetical protein